MIKTKDFRPTNLVQNKLGEVAEIQYLDIEHDASKAIRAWFVNRKAFGTEDVEPIKLTKEWARDLGFEITDMGDFWEFNKGDFQLIQVKVPMTNNVTTAFYVLHSKKSKHIKVPFVHKLQNLYYEVEGTELTFNK